MAEMAKMVRTNGQQTLDKIKSHYTGTMAMHWSWMVWKIYFYNIAKIKHYPVW